MQTLCKPLLTLTADEIMTRNPIVIPRQMSLRAAARLLSQSRITGAPVVDARGVCVGVLSGTDFVHWAEGCSPDQPHANGPSCVCAGRQMVEPEKLPLDEVGAYMTQDPVTAPGFTPITELARLMIDAHIHRIIIVDEKARPTGVVSSTDILAAVAYAENRLGV
jgi:CBS domain-containing protein